MSKSPDSDKKEIVSKDLNSKVPIMKSVHNINEDIPQEFSPLLTCIKSIQGSEALFGSEKLNLFEQLSMRELKSEQSLRHEEGFCFAVSLQDGSTLYVSSAITRHLGYPKDMLVGHCIMNFLYQKDHVTFANHLSQGLNACFTQGFKDESHLLQNTFFCRLRVYHGLKFGFSVSDKKTQYKPYKVTLHINDLIFDDVCVEKAASTLCCRATATPVFSAYQAPEEIPAMTSFSTRHTASCHFSHIDASAIPYLGYLPQDMIGYSVFDFYHTDDMPQLKDIYELVIKERGTSFRSKPYRFKVFNGCYITLETEWSCFINPWSRKLEFVVGQHRVLKGPTNINIFEPCNVEESVVTDEILKESQLIQKEIRNMLVQPIKDCAVGKAKRFCNKRKRDLASFVYSFIDDEGKKRQGDQVLANTSGSDSDSVVMGDISPHQDINNSSTFSETPPLCQEIRYQDNIERFFASQPKTFSDGSEEYKSDKKQHSASGDSTGNGSSDKQQESLPSTSSLKAREDQKQQESSSTSSKYNMSSLTNGDSGYKSLEAINPSSMEQTVTNNTPVWNQSSITETVEKFPCITLTEESLQQHNRLTHKHVKHRKPKTITTAGPGHKENDWVKHNEPGKLNIGSTSHKHRKCARVQTDLPSLTRPETLNTSLPQQSLFNVNPSFSMGTYGIPTLPTITSPTVSSNLNYPLLGMPSYPYLSPNCSQSTTSPQFLVPVMYMGTLPCYPTMPSMAPVNGVPVWPYGAVTPQASSVVFPPLSHGYSMPMSVIQGAQPSSNITNSMNPLVQPSGATATTTVLTTTTTVAPGSLSTPQETKKIENTKLSWCINKSKSPFSDAKDSMQIDDSISFSFTQSSDNSLDKAEDMDYEEKFATKGKRPVREDPFWLSGVDLTHDIVYRYKMSSQNIEDVLMQDMQALKTMTQPPLVSKQLELLRHELQIEKKVKLEDSVMLGLMTQDTVDDKAEIADNEDNLFDAVQPEEQISH